MRCEVEGEGGRTLRNGFGLTRTNMTEDMIWMIMKHEAWSMKRASPGWYRHRHGK